MSEQNQWGNWRQWNAANATGYPDNVSEGDIVQAELAVRVTRIGDTPEPVFISGHVFQVQTAESFLLVPDCVPISTHVVAPRYRVWDGEPNIDTARQATRVWLDINSSLSEEEEDLLRQLIEAANKTEAA